jgi:hypothetical protein
MFGNDARPITLDFSNTKRDVVQFFQGVFIETSKIRAGNVSTTFNQVPSYQSSRKLVVISVRP